MIAEPGSGERAGHRRPRRTTRALRRLGLRGERGQAATEFVFVVIGMMTIFALILTMFHFTQDVFKEYSRARFEMLKEFHDDVQFEQWEKEYRPRSPIRVEIKKYPFISRWLPDIPDYQRSGLKVVGGTRAPLMLSPKWQEQAECALGSTILTYFTQTRNVLVHKTLFGGVPGRNVPGHIIGGVAAFAMCEAQALTY